MGRTNGRNFPLCILIFELIREPGWDRTTDPLLKRQMLYH